MLVTLGARGREPTLVELLAECHHRIRTFAALAETLAVQERLPAAEVREACERAARYFSTALPLHVRDEEDSLAPRLRSAPSPVAAAIADMEREHGEHHSPVAELVAALGALAASPGPQTRRALELRAGPLRQAFERHLVAEERWIFPEVAAWPVGVQAEVLAELRARRT